MPDGATELRISTDGRVFIGWNWHEGMALGEEGVKHGCLVFGADGVRLQHADLTASGPMVRMGDYPRALDDDSPYFDLLFTGCFAAKPGGERWCFDTNSIATAGKRRKATLKLDLSELPTGGSVLEVAGETQFWLFVPRGSGWAVYRTTWASADSYREPDWPRPWKVLSPVR